MTNIRRLITLLYKSIIYPNQIRAYKELISSSRSVKEINSYQIEKLTRILKLAKENIPYYSKLIPKWDVLDYTTFQEIPFLTKKIIRENIEALKNPFYQRLTEVYSNSSGGSTGEPVKFFQTKQYADRAKGSFYYANHLNGVTPYDRTLVLWGAVRDMHHPEKRNLFRRLKDFLSNQRMLNTFVMDDQIILKYIKIMNRMKPKFIKAYVHSIYEIAKYINRNNIKISFHPIIQTTTGPLYPQVRAEIKKAFNNAHIFNYYGSREVSSIASEVLGQQGLQVMFDNIFVEIVDKHGKPVAQGEEGEIVVTTLNNDYMPLIRFKIGDRGIKGDDNTFGTLVLTSVLGRTLGVIYRKDGSYIDGQYFTSLFFNSPGVEKFQLVQNDLENLDVRIIKANYFDPEKFDEILSKIEQELPDIKINVIEVDSIDVGATGKVMYVYSKLQNLE